ncbi:MAG TPA: cytochrome c-type biogenesis protein CcmH [Candidatus Acidoferrum sp.]|nr:cytochrome c-type biogenesis protein CcmH [Candidatus Acidoferrum sp.]
MTKVCLRGAAAMLFGLAALPFWLAPIGAQRVSDRAKQIGMKLKCMCGACSMTAGGCSHPGGEFSGPCQAWALPALQQIDGLLTQGKTEQQVMDAFVAQYGPTVYAEPPKSGFSLVAWVMPTAYLVVGTLVVIFVISRWMKKNVSEIPASGAPAKAISSELLERARKLAEQETEE